MNIPHLKKLIAGVFLLIALVFVASNIYIVDEGERALVLNLGKIDRVQGKGLNIKVPIVEEKIFYSVRLQPGRHEGITAYTNDNQLITASLLVPYRIREEAIPSIYAKYGESFENNLMRRLVQGAFREGIGTTETMTIATEREKIGNRIGKTLALQLDPYGVTIRADGVKVSNIDFSEEFDKRIAQALNEKAAVEMARQNARKKVQQAVARRAKAKGEADARREKADGEAYYTQKTSIEKAAAIQRIGMAEATAIKARGDALNSNPHVVQLFYAEAAKKWNGTLPSRMIPGAALPILNLSGATPIK